MDRFLEQPNLLQGRPKFALGNYVAEAGIPVPRRFSSLEEAMSSNHFIIRSEHPIEYNGPSGLFKSFIVKNGEIQDSVCSSMEELDDIEELDVPSSIDAKAILLFQERLLEINMARLDVRRYCELTGTNESELRKEFTASFWEYLPGLNRFIIADTALHGRYHIFTAGNDGQKFTKNYSIIDNGEIAFSKPEPRRDISDASQLIERYDHIRRMQFFDPNHCPIMEFQTVGDEHYFLQYHRTRDFAPSTFTLDKGDGVLANFVRGATPPEGIVVNTAFYYRRFELHPEEASFDIHYDTVFSELMTRRRRVQFMDRTAENIAHTSLAETHEQKSLLFKPELFVAVNLEDIGFGWMNDHHHFHQMKEEDYATALLHVVSDGRKAYVRKM